VSAETLRRAASLMRERAEAATPGPWRVVADSDTGETSVLGGPYDRYLADVHEWSTGIGNPAHIASWHPAVALAVADWLEVTARDVGTSTLAFHAALAVARAHLGEAL